VTGYYHYYYCCCYWCYYCRIVRNKAADTARMSSRAGVQQQPELGLMLPATSTTRQSVGPMGGITLTPEDEQAAAHLYAIGSLLQGGAAAAGGMTPLTAQQQAALYAAGAGGGGVLNPAGTSLVNRRTPTTDDGECHLPHRSVLSLVCE